MWRPFASVRHSGAKTLSGYRGAAMTVLAIAAIWGVLSAGLFVFFPEPLARLFLDQANPDAADVLAAAVVLLAFAAAFQLFDSLQAVAAGLYAGLKDTRVPMLIAVFSYWIVGVPAAYILAFEAAWPAPASGWDWLGPVCRCNFARIPLFFRSSPPEA